MVDTELDGTDYGPLMVRQARELYADGKTDEEVAHFFNIGTTTLNQWKSKHIEFATTTALSKEKVNEQVVQSLIKRAQGYDHPFEDIRVVNGKVVITQTTKHYPGDVTAQMFILNKRDPANWPERVEPGVGKPSTIEINIGGREGERIQIKSTEVTPEQKQLHVDLNELAVKRGMLAAAKTPSEKKNDDK